MPDSRRSTLAFDRASRILGGLIGFHWSLVLSALLLLLMAMRPSLVSTSAILRQ